MLKIVKLKVEKALRAFAKKHKLERKVVLAIEREVRRDQVLPMLVLNSRTKVKFELQTPDAQDPEESNSVCLYIGPRDFQWDAKTGELIGAGTCLA